MASSWIRDQTHVSCTGRWILHHWATREAQADLCLREDFQDFSGRQKIKRKSIYKNERQSSALKTRNFQDTNELYVFILVNAGVACVVRTLERCRLTVEARVTVWRPGKGNVVMETVGKGAWPLVGISSSLYGGAGDDPCNNRRKPMRLTFGLFLAILLTAIYLGWHLQWSVHIPL